MSSNVPRCSSCGGGPVWGSRCRACKKWQKSCGECSGHFASRRKTAQTCGARCEKAAQRRARLPETPISIADKSESGARRPNTTRGQISRTVCAECQKPTDALFCEKCCAGCLARILVHYESLGMGCPDCYRIYVPEEEVRACHSLPKKGP